MHAPDAGAIELGGADRPPPRRRERGAERGIVTVFQEVLVAEARSVLDNVWLGADEPGPHARPGAREARARAGRCSTELLGRAARPRHGRRGALAERPPGVLHRARARCASREILILDEATSALDVATRDRLFAHRRAARAARASASSSSRTAWTRSARSATGSPSCARARPSPTLERGAVDAARARPADDRRGAAHRARARGPAASRRPTRRGAPVLSVRGLRLRPDGRADRRRDPRRRARRRRRPRGARPGPVPRGAARRGVDRGRGRPSRRRPRRRHPLAAARGRPRHRLRAARAPAGRCSAGCRSARTSRCRRSSATAGSACSACARRDGGFAEYVDRLEHRARRARATAITTLRGGNQQKVVIARWLAADPRVLLLNDPTRGIDIGAKRDLYALLDAPRRARASRS